MSLFSRIDKSFLGQWWWTVDRGLLVAFLSLIILGVLMVATASPPVAEGKGYVPYHFLYRHIVFFFVTIGALIATSMLSPRMIWRLGTLILLGSFVAMLIVMFAGYEVKGAQRWIRLFGFSLQPSEFLKPGFALVAAWLMALQKRGEGFYGDRLSAVLYIMALSLLLMQPDFGMSVVLTCIWGAQIFLAGMPLRYLLGLIVIAVGGAVGAYFSLDHVRSRIDRFINPQGGDNYQVERSLEAFQQGGLFGTGPGQGTIKLSLPDAHADFIFSVAGEEMGVIFILILISLFGFILVRGYNRLMECEDMFIVLAVGGLLTMFGVQAFVHMGSALNVLPAKGMTLPFLSYGGSSMVAMGLAMGAVLALTRRQARRGISRGGLSLKRRA